MKQQTGGDHAVDHQDNFAMGSMAATELSLPQAAASASMLSDELGAELVLVLAAAEAKLQRQPGFAKLVRHLLAVAIRDHCNS